MGILATCPECGLPSPDVRCPRCNALKVIGCGGSCFACKSGCADGSCALPAVALPATPARSIEGAATPEPADEGEAGPDTKGR